ncbi:type II secretion system pseudopilin PulG [Geothrix limicola]|uniref:Type II secretion system pseudopilin PulG n=1 Tax=Geothrix limicola TaxID=2927978 RepID=A0ABQ5QJV9_9BACT|nr:type II secretion system protein [Geothrix limicola]GLH74606.1 type II secretion system pseudopilin PulG [Geothrix limicola]
MSRQRGFTLLELVVTATVLMILASVVVPLARNGLKRQQEIELRRDLREMRAAIDDYKRQAEQQKIKAPPAEANFYPESLEILVEGVPAAGSLNRKVKFLRRIPVDPFTGKAEWGLRNTNDDPTSTSWGGGHVYDVYSLSQGTGMNGIPYREW